MNNQNLRKPREYENPLCAQVGPSFFYLDDYDDDTLAPEGMNTSYNTALQICKNCEHILECAEWGLKYESHGVWGGLTPYDRRNIRTNKK